MIHQNKPKERYINNLFIEVIDNYYTDPHSVRDFALSCNFSKPFTGTWNGLHSIQRHPDTKSVFFDLAYRIPEKGRPNWEEIEGGYQFWGRPSAGIFSLLFEQQKDTVHFHRRTGTWAGVCYLSLPHDCKDRLGVIFYRHKATGCTNIKDLDSKLIEIFRRDAKERECWEEIEEVNMSFNRMIIFDGRFFHAASDGFGQATFDGRLAQLFNIDFV